jgi:large subunit ribosomal protein L25
MENTTLNVEMRTESGSASARRLRRAGRVPAVLYGLKRDARHLSMSTHDMMRILEKGEHVVELVSDETTQVVLIKDVAFDGLGSSLEHVDFVRIDRDVKVQVNIPIVFSGNAPTVTNSTVDKILDHVQVEVLPLEIPAFFEVSLTTLEVGSQVLLGDLEIGDCILVNCSPEDTVAVNHVVHVVEETTDTEEDEGAEGVEPEVIGESKDDDSDSDGD